MIDEKTTHESYGMLSFTRIQSNRKRPLFGSSLTHTNTINVKVSRAVSERRHNQDWYFPTEVLIELDISPTQFIDAITNMNTIGVPCTLRYVNGEEMEDCPFEPVVETFEKELNDDIKNILGRTAKLMKMVEEKLKAPGNISKKVRNEMAQELYHIEQDIRANLPFVYEQFNNQMDKSVVEAKNAIEAFFTQKIHSLGSEELVKQLEEGKLSHPAVEK